MTDKKKRRTKPTAASESPLVGAERRKRAYEQFKQVYYALPAEKRTLALLSLKTGIGFRLLKEEYLPMLEAEEDEESEGEKPQKNPAFDDPEGTFAKLKAKVEASAEYTDPVTNPNIARY